MTGKSRKVQRAMLGAVIVMFGCDAAQAQSQIGFGIAITTYGVYTTGAYIYFSPGIPNLEGCTNAAGNEVWIDFGQPEGKTLYATVMAAYAAGQKVGFGVSGCAGQLPVVYRVDVQ